MLPYVASFPEPDGRFPMMLGIALAVALLSALSAVGSLAIARRGNLNVLDDRSTHAKLG